MIPAVHPKELDKELFSIVEEALFMGRHGQWLGEKDMSIG